MVDPIQIVDNGLEAIAYMMGEGKYADRKTYAYPTFVITDLKMPQADGFSVLEFLKGNPEWAIIPTIVFPLRRTATTSKNLTCWAPVPTTLNRTIMKNYASY